jgi:hypothetical protein
LRITAFPTLRLAVIPSRERVDESSTRRLATSSTNSLTANLTPRREIRLYSPDARIRSDRWKRPVRACTATWRRRTRRAACVPLLAVA